METTMINETFTDEARPLYFEYDGLLIAGDGSGEFLGVVRPDGTHELFADANVSFDTEDGLQDAIKPGAWFPSDEDGALWFLEKRGRLLMKLAALRLQRDAAISRMDKEIDRATKEVERFDGRFKAVVLELAKNFLPKGKKTWTTPFGAVKYTTTAARLSVESPEKALAWASKECSEAIRVPEPKPAFMISQVPKDIKAALMELPDGELTDLGFAVIPAHEKAEVDQGEEQ